MRLSSGFHQVAPIVVQASVKKRNDTFFLENQEVHFHPDAQTALTEFFVREVYVGKCLVVETHSDLLLCRVLKTVLQEELPRSAVAVYFASLCDAEGGARTPESVTSSRLEPLRIDERCRIENRPDAFMSHEMREARRRLGVLYGDDE